MIRNLFSFLSLFERLAENAKAKKRIKGREEKRTAFIKKSFHKDARNPLHYDMVLNTEFMSLEDCTDLISLYLERKYKLN